MTETKRQGAARRELPAAVGDSARSALLSRHCADSASKPDSAAPWDREGASKRGGRACWIPKGPCPLARVWASARPSRKADSPRCRNRGLLYIFGGLPAIRPPAKIQTEGSIILRQQNGRNGTVPFSEDPELDARWRAVGGQKAVAMYHCRIVGLPILWTDVAPVTGAMPGERHQDDVVRQLVGGISSRDNPPKWHVPNLAAGFFWCRLGARGGGFVFAIHSCPLRPLLRLSRPTFRLHRHSNRRHHSCL